MKVMLSACLAGENCKYNGGNNYYPELMERLSEDEVIPVCPEMMGGLPTPRVPAEIRDGVVFNRNGASVDREFRLGAEKCLELAEKEKPDLIIFQARSPSCGVSERYDGSFSGSLINAPGVTASLLMEHGFRVIDAEAFLNET